MVFAATGNQGLLKTEDGGESWVRLSGKLPDSDFFSTVAIDPFHPEKVYTAVESGGLYRSLDQGESWEMISAGLIPEMKITDIVFDPVQDGVLYLSDIRSGVYRSMDGGDSWQAMSEALRTRAVNALALSSDGQHLYAATEGEGVFRIDLNGIPVEVSRFSPPSLSFRLEPNFPNPFNPQTMIRYRLAQGSRVEIGVYNVLGREVAVLMLGHQTAGVHQTVWDASGMASGVYLIRMKTDHGVQYHKCHFIQ